MTQVVISISDYKHQRSLRLYLRLIFHFVCLVVFCLVIAYALYLWYLFFISDIEDPQFWNVKYYTPFYVTHWNFTFQTIFLTMSLVYDTLEWMDHHQSRFGQRLRYYRDIMFCGLVVPVTVFISTFFWTIFWIDRELVFPEIYDQIVPWWFNHCVHTNILIVIGIETLLQARRHPANLKVELWLTGIIGVVYAIVYYGIYFSVHRWLYGVFGVMTWWQVCLFQILIWGYTFFSYWLQFPINRIFHRADLEINEAKTEFTDADKPTLNGSLVNYWDSKLRTSFEDTTKL